MATTRHRSLVERGEREAFVRDKGLAHTQTGGGGARNEIPDIHESTEKGFEHMRASSKAT